MKIQPYTILKKETLVQEPYCHIEKHRVGFPNGGEGDWYVKLNADAVIVLPILETGEVLLQRSYKHGSENIIVECVAGLVDEGEDPLDTARRELQEETGYSSDTLEYKGTVFANPTGSNMKYHFFVASDCVQVGEQMLDEAEQIEIFTVPSVEAAKTYLLQKDIYTTSATRAMLSYV